MKRRITRRDFVQGAVAGGAALALGNGQGSAEPRSSPGEVGGKASHPLDPSHYPPARHGLRGSHPGSFETAHELARNGRTDWGAIHEPDDAGDDLYDLVVVGSGVSGLAAAHFYRQQKPDARILLLENHDDFGGHARRNEFQLNGRTILGHGGSQSLEAPNEYSKVSKRLLADLSVDLERLSDGYDLDFYRRNGLAGGIYFDAKTYGVNRLVRTDFHSFAEFLGTAPTGVPPADDVRRMPISEPAQQELLALLQLSEDRLPEQAIWAEPGYLNTISYHDFLARHLGVTQPEVFALFHDMPSDYMGHGIDCTPALLAIGMGLPGFGGTSLRHVEGLIRKLVGWWLAPYTYHFPDGNASVARLLVRSLIPAAAEGATMDDVVLANFDYTALDRADSPVRLRLSSTVVNVENEGSAASAKQATVTYIRAGRANRVRARSVVLACYNSVIPHLCPKLPKPQKAALRSLVKVPLVYTNVLLGNWRAFKNLGVGVTHNPGSWHQSSMLDFPVSLPGYRYSSNPDQAIVLHMSRRPTTPGLTPREQSRAGRFQLLKTSFEEIERQVRTHLGGMLGAGGFDPARDIEGIVVNRWPHGYAFETNPLFDPETAEGQAPHEIGRQLYGRIAIANSDAAGSAYLDAAIDEGWRAAGELTG